MNEEDVARTKALVSVLRFVAVKEDDELAALLAEVSKGAQNELLRLESNTRKEFECSVCSKRFRR